MQTSKGIPPEQLVSKIAAIEKFQLEPRRAAIGCLVSGVLAGLIVGLLCSYLSSTGWQVGVLTGVPISLLFVFCGPLTLEYFVSKQHKALQNGRNIALLDVLKPSAGLGKLVASFVIFLAVAICLEACLVWCVGFKQTNSSVLIMLPRHAYQIEDIENQLVKTLKKTIAFLYDLSVSSGPMPAGSLYLRWDI